MISLSKLSLPALIISLLSVVPVVSVVAVVPAWAGADAGPKGEKDPNQIFDPSLLQGLEYRLAGPTRGGRVTAVTGVAGQPYTFYMGASGGGVWKTGDGGGT